MNQPKSLPLVVTNPESSGNFGESVPQIPVDRHSAIGKDSQSTLKPDNDRDNRIVIVNYLFQSRPVPRLWCVLPGAIQFGQFQCRTIVWDQS